MAVLCLLASARADIAVTLLGDPAAMKGAKFEADPKTKKLYTRVDVMGKNKVAVTLPSGQVVSLPAEQVTIQSEEGWINQISCRGGEAVPVKDAIATIETFLTANKLELTEAEKKKWDAFKASPKSYATFSAKVKPWTSIRFGVSLSGDKGSHEVNFYGDPDGDDPDPLPAGGMKVPVGNCAFSPDSKWIADVYKVCEAATGKEIAKIEYAREANAMYYYPPKFSADGKWMATGTDKGKFNLIDTATWTVKNTFPIADVPERTPARPLGFSPTSDLLYVLAGDEIRVVAVADGAEKLRFEKLPFKPKGVALSNEGKLIAISRDGGKAVTIYNTADGKVAKTFEPKKLPVGVTEFELTNADMLQFGPGDKTLIVSGFMGSKQGVWSLESDSIVNSMSLQKSQGMAASADGKYYAVGSWATMWGPNGVYLYDASTGEAIGAARPFGGVFVTAAFSPDGNYVAFARATGRETLLFKTAELAKAKPGPLVKKP